jgi:uncharacterized protein
MSTAPDAAEAEQAEQREQVGLAYQRCRWCGTPAYRRLLCPTCASSDFEAARSQGVGIVTRPPISSLAEAAVQLREGFSVQGRVLGAVGGRVPHGSVVRLAADPDPDLPNADLLFRLYEDAPDR